MASQNAAGITYAELARSNGLTRGQVARRVYDYKHKRRRKKRLTADVPAKILIFDIETTPILAFTWGVWQQNIPYTFIEQDWHLLSWAAKWLFDSEIMSDVLTPREAKKHDDLRATKSMWTLLDEADIVVAHNAKGFDVKKLNTRFIYHGLTPPSHYHIIDTLTIARSVFKFTSNKLDSINDILGLDKKIETEFELWRQCYYGNKEALHDMEVYNIHDVLILEEAYLKIRPWIKNHPNVNVYGDMDKQRCKNCASDRLCPNGEYTTPLSVYNSFRCENCGALNRNRTNSVQKEQRTTLLR